MGLSAAEIRRNETHRAQIEGYLAGRRTAAPSTFKSCFTNPGIERVNLSTNSRRSGSSCVSFSTRHVEPGLKYPNEGRECRRACAIACLMVIGRSPSFSRTYRCTGFLFELTRSMLSERGIDFEVLTRGPQSEEAARNDAVQPGYAREVHTQTIRVRGRSLGWKAVLRRTAKNDLLVVELVNRSS